MHDPLVVALAELRRDLNQRIDGMNATVGLMLAGILQAVQQGAPMAQSPSNAATKADIAALQAHMDERFTKVDTDVAALATTMATLATKDDVAAIDTGGGDGGDGGGGDDTDYFPADPILAPFPSPENSQIMVLDGEIGGRPYLKDQSGAVHQIKKDAAGVPQYYKNSTEFALYPGEEVAQCLVRQGEVYMQITGGIWKHVAANGSLYNTTLPPAWVDTGDGGGGVQLPPLGDMPTPSPIAPGSSGRIIDCGQGTAIATIAAGIAAARAGDTVRIAKGTYNEPIPTITVPIILDGGGSTLSGAGLTGQLAGGGKGLIVPRADCVIRNIVAIVDVAMDQTDGQLTSAIRPDDGCGYLTVENCDMHNNQCGIGSGGFNVVISVSNCDISGNGLKSNTGSLTHNLYVGQACRRLTLTNVVSLASNEAHAIKYRGPELIVNGGTFGSPHGSCFDVPNGSTVISKVSQATLTKEATDDDHKIIHYAEEAQDNGLAGMIFTGCTINALCESPVIAGGGGTIQFVGCTTTGNPITAVGVTVTGL